MMDTQIKPDIESQVAEAKEQQAIGLDMKFFNVCKLFVELTTRLR